MTRRRHRRARRAGAVLIGGVILVGILATTLTTYFLTTYQLERARAATVASRLASDEQQQQEHFVVVPTIILGNISAEVSNEGPIPIQIAYLLVVNATNQQVVGRNDTAALASPINVAVGQSSVPIVSNFPAPNTGVFEVLVLTGRGTTARGLYPPSAPEFIGSGINVRLVGLLTIEILSFNFTSADPTGPGGGCTASEAWANWTTGFEVPSNKCLVWRINITNNDPTRHFYLAPHSHMFLMQAESSNTLGLFLVKAQLSEGDAYTPTPANLAAPLVSISSYSVAAPQIIPARSWRMVYFSATSEGGATPERITADQFALFILVNGWFTSVLSGESYGQNIPFIALRGI